ncbi:hypothetical protein IMSAGC005_00053 [Lachnospiraceae bacterium]|nr:hypothetical protein IMSAGC005_00053 [Lachnospiraceae bacterium]
MKWINRGHEYDDMYKQIENKSAFYLFGAGDYGRQFVNIFGGEININSFIDNSVKKQGTNIAGLPCVALSAVELKQNEGIIVTMSQIARTAPVQQLLQLGYKRNVDFFIIEEFISVYHVYKYNKVYFSSISFLPSTACNLKCRYCLNFNPFAKKFYVRKWEDLVEDVDLFFSCVDRIMLFHVSGGEPLLYAHTADIIEYIDGKYGDRIDTLRTVTNGTVVPTDEVLIKLSRCDLEIVVDDYREAVPEYNDNFDRLIKKLKEYNIKYYINRVDSWIDLAPERTDYASMTEDWLLRHREQCGQSWQELRNGKIYNCNYAAYATVAGIAGEEDAEEAYDLRMYDESKQKELIEFRLGYSQKGYTNFCKKCRGFKTENNEEVKPAIQA